MFWWAGRRGRRPDASTVVTYGSGSEHDPGDPFGLCVLSLTAEGRALLDNRRGGRSRRWHGEVVDAVLVDVLAALETAGFPRVPPHRIPPGPTRTLTVATATQTMSAPPMGYHEAMRWPGYRDAFSLLDRIVVALRDEALAVVEHPADDLVRIDWRRTEPPIRRPVVATPWTVTYCTLREVDPDRLAPDDERWGWLTEDQVWVEHPDGRAIDVGWYPDNSPTGTWRVSLVAEGVARTCAEHRSVDAVVEEVARLSAQP